MFALISFFYCFVSFGVLSVIVVASGQSTEHLTSQYWQRHGQRIRPTQQQVVFYLFKKKNILKRKKNILKHKHILDCWFGLRL